jgi:hypothetical protein
MTGALKSLESLASLELWLEISKRIGDLRKDIFKRMYDMFSVIESYENNHLDLHIQGLADPTCQRHHEAQAIFAGEVRGRIWVISVPKSYAVFGAAHDEMPMLIRVRNADEPFRPINSVIRLQVLDFRRMQIVDSLQKSVTVSAEIFWAVCNWELSVLLFRAGVKDGESVNEIIKARPKMVDDFPDENGEANRNQVRWRVADLQVPRLVNVCISTNRLANLVGFFIEIGAVNGFQLLKAFSCPVKPEIGVIQGMHDI